MCFAAISSDVEYGARHDFFLRKQQVFQLCKKPTVKADPVILAAFYPTKIARATLGFVSTVYRHRALLYQQIRRDLLDQHAGQMLGGLWVILHPLFIMLVYVSVFALVFQVRIGDQLDTPLDYTSYILSGLAVWLAMVQALSKTASSVYSQASLIKQVVFPLEILPVKAALSTLAPLGVMLTVYFVYTIGIKQHFLETFLLIPVLFLIYVLWVVGIGLILASLSVFVRDIREFIQLFTVAGIFLLPIVYLPSSVPAIFKPILYLNPFSYLIWCFQDVLYYGRIEHPVAWIVAIGGGLLLLGLGSRIFRALKPYFGDAL